MATSNATLDEMANVMPLMNSQSGLSGVAIAGTSVHYATVTSNGSLRSALCTELDRDSEIVLEKRWSYSDHSMANTEPVMIRDRPPMAYRTGSDI